MTPITQSKFGTITVANGRQVGFTGLDKLYIGRANPHPKYNLLGSVLANPYSIGRDGTREQVVSKYRVWLWQEIKKQGVVYQELISIANRIKASNDITLICYCKPLDCHGDIVKRAVEWLINQEKND